METHKKRGMIITRESSGVLVLYFTVNTVVFPTDVESAGRDLMRVLDETDLDRIVIEFSALKQISSGFVSKLLVFGRELSKRGGSLVLCAMTPQVEQVFRILRLQKIFTIRKGEFEAINEIVGQ